MSLSDTTNLEGMVSMLESRATVQRNFSRLEDCVDRNYLKEKLKVLYLGQNDPYAT